MAMEHPPSQESSGILTIARTRQRLLWIVLALAGSIYFFLWEPGRTGYFLPCLVQASTGLYCPGCGAQRAFHALLHGQIFQAAGYNLLIVLGLPAAVLLFLDHFLGRQRFARALATRSHTVIAFLAGTAFLFTLLRNIPWPPFDGLAP